MVSRHAPSFFPIVALLIVALIVFYPALKKLPEVEELLSATSKTSVEEPAIKVWVNKRSKLYYRRQSESYGKLKPGLYMSLWEAERSGYRPAARQACK
jgi:hypothetical protein